MNESAIDWDKLLVARGTHMICPLCFKAKDKAEVIIDGSCITCKLELEREVMIKQFSYKPEPIIIIHGT